MINKDFGYLVRPEAGPVDYQFLPKRVQRAFNRIVNTLHAVSEGLARSGEVSSCDIDTQRASRLFFVSGEPGSGKSTLYVSLRNALCKTASPRTIEGMPEKLKSAVNSLSQSVCWLEVIDLEVVGEKEENMLAAVLVRLFDALDGKDNTLSEKCEAAIRKLEELAADIGIAWDGNLKARGGALDPDNFSEEVMRAQRAKLGINKRLREAMYELAVNHCCGCSKDTLFILPIDDFYLKPEASLLLLRLLRMISIPRLFFLIMGDITTIEALFLEKALADWTAVAGIGAFNIRKERFDEALLRARELRARYLRKLLPLGQRAEIEVMDWYESLGVNLDWSLLDGSKFRIFRDILSAIKLDPSNTDSPCEKDNASKTLLEFLVPAKDLANEDPSKIASELRSPENNDFKKNLESYSALQILDATPREILDFASSLVMVHQERKENATGDPKVPHLLNCIFQIAKQSGEEQSFLNAKEQKILEGILPKQHYDPERMWFNMNPLEIEPECLKWKKVDLPNSSGRFWYREHRLFQLKIHLPQDGSKSNDNSCNKQDSDQADTFYGKLPPRPAAWYILLHDLLQTWQHTSLNGNLVESLIGRIRGKGDKKRKNDQTPSPTDNKPSCQEIDEFGHPPEFGGWFYRENLTTKTRKREREKVPKTEAKADIKAIALSHFPLPVFKTIREMDCFIRIWNSGLKYWHGKPGKYGIDQKKLVDLWFVSGLIVLLDIFSAFSNMMKCRVQPKNDTVPEADMEKQNKILQDSFFERVKNSEPSKSVKDLGEILETPKTDPSQEVNEWIEQWENYSVEDPE